MRNRAENQIKLVLIRHGATEGNKEHRYIGRTDEPLSSEAKEKLSAEANCYPRIDRLFTSPMKRCIETAEIIYPDKKPVVVDPLREMDFGEFEGKNYEELNGDQRYQAWIDSGGTIAFPNGESREEFIKRCCEGLREVFFQIEVSISQKEKIVQSEKGLLTIGLVVHGGTIMALCSAFGGGDYFDYQVANGAGYICDVYLDGEEIRFQSIQKIALNDVN